LHTQKMTKETTSPLILQQKVSCLAVPYQPLNLLPAVSQPYERLLILAITPRSQKHAKILRNDWAEAQKTGIDFSQVHFEESK